MIYKTVKTNGLSIQLKPLPPKPQPPSLLLPTNFPQANAELGLAAKCQHPFTWILTPVHFSTLQHNISQVSYISSGHPDFKCLREMNPCNLKYVTLPCCVLEHLTRSPKYVTPPRGHWLFWSKKCPSGFDIAIKATKTPSRPR